ncbi:unnamed protein product, partial [Laminaria digitata]
AERLVRKVTRLGNVKYGASPRDASPEPKVGLFCRVREPPSSPSVLSLPRRSTARFSDSGDLEVVNSKDKVLWSAREGVNLRSPGEKGGAKHSPDLAKVKIDSKRRKKEERDNSKRGRKEERENSKRRKKEERDNRKDATKADKGGWGARVRKLWGKDS